MIGFYLDFIWIEIGVLKIQARPVMGTIFLVIFGGRYNGIHNC